MVGKNLAPVIIKRKRVIVSGGASWWRLESRLCGFRHSNDGFLHTDVVAECDHGEAKKGGLPQIDWSILLLSKRRTKDGHQTSQA